MPFFSIVFTLLLGSEVSNSGVL